MTTPIVPVIDINGITAYGFTDCLAWLQSTYRSIYGDDVYLGNDSQDGQFIAALAQAFADLNSAAVAVYNAFSPATAQGNGLSSVVKINGLERFVPSRSTVDVKLVGIVGTTITNGQVSDTAQNVWNLPASVTIPLAGEIIVTATANADGAISASIGAVNKIKTPRYGWQSVTNLSEAVEGAPIEVDPALRTRQSQSVTAPSQSIFEGIVASIKNISGVTRSMGYENASNTTDANSIPAHSLAFIVEGGDVTEIATAIALRKTPGTPTVGAISTTITDSNNSTSTIKFSRPTQAVIKVHVNIQALTGWTTDMQPIIAQALADYLNALKIGDDVIYTRLFVPANLSNTQYESLFNITSLTVARDSGSPGTANIAIGYNEVAFGDPVNMTFTVS